MTEPRADATENARTRRGALVWLVGIVAFVLIIAALRAASVITLPLAFSFFLCVLVYPIQRALQHRLHRRLRWVSTVAAMSALVFAAAIVAGAAWLVFELVSASASDHAEAIGQAGSDAVAWLEHRGIPVNEESLTSDRALERAASWATLGFTSLAAFTAYSALVFFLTLLMLIEADHWARKASAALGDGAGAQVVEAAQTVARKVRQYLVVRTLISLLTGVVIWGWLALMGVELALVWGILAFVLNYVPNLGSVIATIPPSVLALAQFGFGRGAIVILGLIAIQQTIGSFIDPRLQGRRLRISPLVVLVSVVFWGWMWGVAGAFIAVPMAAATIVVLAHIPALRPVAQLLSNIESRDELVRNTRQ